MKIIFLFGNGDFNAMAHLRSRILPEVRLLWMTPYNATANRFSLTRLVSIKLALILIPQNFMANLVFMYFER